MPPHLETPTMSNLNSELTELLRDMRHQAGLTQVELGRRMGWIPGINPRGHETHGEISRYEHGKRVPKFELVGRWAAACGYTAELVVYPRAGAPWVVALNNGPQP
jgi:transcriptional regulator with XRE-family HTH domain